MNDDWLLDKDKTKTKEELLTRVAELRYKLSITRGVISKLGMDVADYRELIKKVLNETSDGG